MHQHPVAPAGQPGRLRRRTGTPRRRSPASRWRSARTRRTCSARQLWRETRIPLFEQATDTRAEELKAQGVRPRVWFGERWITSIFDLFEENVRYFPALLPICDDEDPVAVLDVGRHAPRSPSCGCTTAPSTAGTGRCTTSVDGVPHLRVENRVLPAGPTVVDTMANAAFYFGLVRGAGRRATGRCGRQMSFQRGRGELPRRRPRRHRRRSLLAGRRRGPATELVLRRLLPLADEGLDGVGRRRRASARPAARHHRAALPDRHNGADWFVRRTADRTGGRDDALRHDPGGVPRAHARQRPRARVVSLGVTCCAGLRDSAHAALADRGESHGPSLVAILEGLPAHVEVTDRRHRRDALARRRLGYGRGARMKFEQDEVDAHRRASGTARPRAARSRSEVGNTEWPKWEKVMSADPVDAGELDGLARNAPLTRPRPGHADLAGMQKYDFDDARPILERASARETAARVALGRVATQLPRAGGRRPDRVRTSSRSAASGPRTGVPSRRRRRLDDDPVRCLDPHAASRWSSGSTRRTRTATPSAAWSRSSCTACRRASARTCTGTGASTPGSPAR